MAPERERERDKPVKSVFWRHLCIHYTQSSLARLLIPFSLTPLSPFMLLNLLWAAAEVTLSWRHKASASLLVLRGP